MQTNFELEKAKRTHRDIVFKVLIGSHNYNLNTPKSDKDYKYFVFPDFDDLYRCKQYTENYTSPTEDFAVYDIRKLPMLLWKANLNFIEVLFSQELIVPEPYTVYWGPASRLCRFLEENKKELAIMNPIALYNASRGMALEKQKQMLKDSPGRHENYARFGYDTKSASHAYRILDFLCRLEKNGCDMQKAMYYEDNDPARQVILDIKAGKYSLESFNIMIKIKESQTEQLKDFFESKTINKTLYEQLEEKAKQAVKHYFYLNNNL